MKRQLLGQVYADIMRDSGISLPNGKYISALNFAKKLEQYGAPKRRAMDINSSWCSDIIKDQVIRNYWEEKRGESYITHYFATTFSLADVVLLEIEPGQNPKELLEKEQAFTETFLSLPYRLREQIYGLDQSSKYALSEYFEELGKGKKPKPRKEIKDMAEEIRDNLPEDLDLYTRMDDIFYEVLEGDCTGKEARFKQLIEFNTQNIPTQWTEGQIIKKAVKKRLDDLTLRE